MIVNAPVLYAEDDVNDAFLLERAFSKADIINPLVIVSDGNAAIDYLSGKGNHYQRNENPFPCLVLLDLKMPGKSGLEVLEWMRNEPTVSTLPVLMFTSSSQEKDVRHAYLLGANGYLLKPSLPDGLLSLVRALKDFWLSSNLYIGPARQVSDLTIARGALSPPERRSPDRLTPLELLPRLAMRPAPYWRSFLPRNAGRLTGLQQQNCYPGWQS